MGAHIPGLYEFLVLMTSESPVDIPGATLTEVATISTSPPQTALLLISTIPRLQLKPNGC